MSNSISKARGLLEKIENSIELSAAKRYRLELLEVYRKASSQDQAYIHDYVKKANARIDEMERMSKDESSN